MKYKLSIKILAYFLLLLCFYNTKSYGQDCTETLTQARNLYAEGSIEGIPEMLEGCIKNGFTKEEKVQAYKLIIQVYIFEDKITQAEETLLKLKKANPVYQIDYANDGAEFIALFNQFETTAFLSFGLNGGLNYPIIQIIQPFATSNLKEYTPTYSRTGANFQIYGRLLYQPISNIDIFFNPGFMKSNYNYQYTEKDFFNDEENLGELNFTENLSIIHLPIGGMYNYPFGKIVPYAFAGFDVGIILSSSMTGTKNYLSGNLNPIEGSFIDYIEFKHRNALQKSIIYGAGVKYKLSRVYAFFEIQHFYTLDILENKANRHNNNELNYRYKFIDDDLKMYNLMLSAGFTYSIYQHKKKQ